ncbi:puromycin-sensitive aminopeptidase isoform 1 [Planoprotostelium fungivorum]|uniref:Aminopeptidase n=1 Tax=Planoprotostelium fungivorum TaxID=1890364 RepID=A0A2P6NIR0_9EUKA|nr:puromycin-sensitive aminopeptidase isoform 1 [Planoprotostelium fungivorum]
MQDNTHNSDASTSLLEKVPVEKTICLGLTKKALGIVIAAFIVLAGLVGIVVAFWAINNTNAKKDLNSQNPVSFSFRLPTDVIPVHYDVHFDFDIHGWTYIVRENIVIDIKNKSIEQIVLHLDNNYLDLDNATLISPDDRIIFTNNIVFNSTYQTVAIVFGAELKTFLQGNYSRFNLSLECPGIVSDGGLTRSNYLDEGGVIKTVAVTDLEPTGARSVYPCFDEPSLKATFNTSISIDTTTGFTAISNMPILSTLPDDPDDTTVQRFQFETTKKMSTYLLCFTISQYAATEAVTSSNVTIRVHAPVSRIQQGIFARDTAVKAIEAYVQYFGIDFPLPKLDLVAIPDFSSIGMENWGIATFSMEVLLWDDQVSSIKSQQYIAKVVSHEICHHWLGDLVTLSWWDNLWLNEGFTQYHEYVGVDSAYPEWKIFDQFIKIERDAAMRSDGVESAHQLVTPVEGPKGMLQLFDPITYSKGASLVRMIKNRLGQETFQKALTNYLKKFSYSNANTSDLLSSFYETTHDEGLSQFVINWSTQPGFPAISVVSKPGAVSLSQGRSDMNGQSTSQLWSIPVTLQTDKGILSVMMDNATIEVPTNDTLVYVNVDGDGYYRVKYDATTRDTIVRILSSGNWTLLSSKARGSIVDDAISLLFDQTLAVDANYTMSIVKYLGRERALVPWQTAAEAFERILDLTEGSECHVLLQAFLRNITTSVVETLGWSVRPEDTHDDLLLRGEIFSLAVSANNTDVIRQGYQLFLQAKSLGNPPNTSAVDLWPIMLESAGRNNNGTNFHWMLKRYQESLVPTEKEDLLAALCTFEGEAQMNELLAISLNPNTTSVDSVGILKRMGMNSQLSRKTAWNFLKQNWSAYEQANSGSAFIMADILTVPSLFSTKEDYNDVKDFLEKHQVVSAQVASEEVVEKIDGNIKWREGRQQALTDWLKEYLNQ